MPSGRTHDLITIALVPAAFAVAYAFSRDAAISTVATAGLLFGGLMFGPDLDTGSKQYSRWSFLKVLWFPYRMFFRHRSRWSHGLIFGTFVRVVYFIGVVTMAAFVGAYAYASVTSGRAPEPFAFARSWQTIGGYVSTTMLAAVFAGLWAGAASHTLTDMAGTFVKTGRITEFL